MGFLSSIGSFFGGGSSRIPRINSITGADSGGSGGGFLGIDGSDWLGAGMTMLGGFLDQRSDERMSREEIAARGQISREGLMANRAGDREGLRVGMQRDQDTYARDIMRNRAAIAPWGERYRGPAFTQANPNAAIYNPLMEQGHIYGELSQPLQAPPGMKQPWNGG